MCSACSPDYSLNLTEAFILELCRLKTPLHDVEVRSTEQMEAEVSLIKTEIFFARDRGRNRKMLKQFTTVQLCESCSASQLFTNVFRTKNVTAPSQPQLVTDYCEIATIVVVNMQQNCAMYLGNGV